MTIDDNSSIYVGGLPYDITEEGLRRVFYIYGAVLAVKIINDRTVGGKCYGFITFANPRSATQAIKEMDGKTVDGRVIKVNEVRSRSSRSNFNRDGSRHDWERSSDGDRRRDDSYERHHNEGYWGHEQNRDRDHDRFHGYNRRRNRYVDEERFQDYDRDVDDVEPPLVRKRERDWERDSDKNFEHQRNSNHHKSGDKEIALRSRFDDRGSRELSLESFNDEPNQGESKLAVSNEKLEDIRAEIARMEELVTEKQDFVSKLQEKCQKLEDSLIQAKKLTSHRHGQLAKLHKCYLQMRDYDDKLKKSEQELQWLVDSSLQELGKEGGGFGASDARA